VEYDPEAFTSTSSQASVVSVYFSEGVESESASLVIYAPDGVRYAGQSFVEEEDPRRLSAELPSAMNGIYTASWKVVSRVDGHFTNGAFSFYRGAVDEAPVLYGGKMVEGTRSEGVCTLCELFFHPRPPLWSLSRTDASRVVYASDGGVGEDVLRLRAFSASKKPILGVPPLVVLHNGKEGIGPLVVPAKERGGGVYDIPWALFTPQGEWHVAVTWKDVGEYDINTTFRIDYPREILEARAQNTAERRINIIPIIILIVLLDAPLLIIWYNWRHARQRHITGASTGPTSATDS
jgi:methionine-rich copper-binding protein CopC